MARRLRGRFRRRPLLLGVLLVAVLSGALVFALGARPTAELGGQVIAEPIYVGTTYAFDGVVCLGSQVAGSTVEGVEVEQAAGTTTDLVRGPDGAPTLGFPVDLEAQEEVDGLEVPAGELDCTQRLLVTPDTVRVVDFKTSRAVPSDINGVSAAYLRQLRAYIAALRVIFPGRAIEAALLFTSGPRLFAIDAD